MIKAIIFDVDGVLIDADYSREEKYRKVCKMLKVKFTNEFKEVIHSKNYSGIDYVQKKLNLSKYFVKQYADGVDIDLSFYPAYYGTDSVLYLLSKKYRLVAYSAASSYLTLEKLNYNNLMPYFEEMFCGNDGDSNSKKQNIEDAIHYLDLKPEEIAIVDDRVQAGIVIGNKLGLHTIRIDQGVHKNNEYVPDEVINSIGGLL